MRVPTGMSSLGDACKEGLLVNYHVVREYPRVARAETRNAERSVLVLEERCAAHW
jgi:hypothetical protein